jgi:hypothetical protein
MPYEARIREARKLLGALAEVAKGRVPESPKLPPAPKPALAPAKKSVFRPAIVPPAPKGAATRPIPLPGRWKR